MGQVGAHSKPPNSTVPYREVLQRPKPQHIEVRGNSESATAGENLLETNQTFLELKQQIKTIQEQMQLLMLMIKSPAQQINPSLPGMGWINRN